MSVSFVVVTLMQTDLFSLHLKDGYHIWRGGIHESHNCYFSRH